MADIQTLLKNIMSAVYGKDVRQSIHDAIYQCYQDGKAGTLDLVARTNIDNVKNNISNPNLLINGDFRNPINQREKDTYTTLSSEDIYAIDRWRMNYNSKLVINDGYVTLEGNTANNNYWRQPLEHELNGTFTLSVKVRAVSGVMYMYYSDDNGSVNTITLKEGINTRTFEAVNLRMIGFCAIKTGAIADIEWVKLEQGVIATPFVPRLYDEELAICRRYYRSNGMRLVSWQHTTTYAYFAYNYEPMRVAPKFSYTGFAETQNQVGTVATSTAVQVLGETEIDRLSLRITFNDSSTAYYRCASGRIMLDAEIY